MHAQTRTGGAGLNKSLHLKLQNKQPISHPGPSQQPCLIESPSKKEEKSVLDRIGKYAGAEPQ